MKPEVILKKLQFHKSASPLIINAPEEYKTLLKDIQFDIRLSSRKRGSYDFIQIFATTQKELEKLLREHRDSGIEDCIFWACYPKGSGKIKSDIKRDTVWEAFGLIGLKTVTNVSIDETWSALRARPYAFVGK